MVAFVCEGREMTDGVYGLTTEDVANVLLDLGCKEAINLDGGGSSCMLVCGKNTIKVSDGSQRAVASTIMIK
jgi:exopolysaccharide biosynthesis protein